MLVLLPSLQVPCLRLVNSTKIAALLSPVDVLIGCDIVFQPRQGTAHSIQPSKPIFAGRSSIH
jgi:hypothetical protein